MKKIRLFEVECGSEEEGYVYYFDGEGSEEDFQRDVRECVVQVLDKYYKFIEIDKNTLVRKRALDNENVGKFLDWVRNEFGYKGKILVDVEDDLVLFATEDFETSYKIQHSKDCPVNVFYDLFISRIEAHNVVECDEFIKLMKERGWEYVEIGSKGKVWFYEWGGFVQGEDGRWYNHIWNWGYEDVLTGEERDESDD